MIISGLISILLRIRANYLTHSYDEPSNKDMLYLVRYLNESKSGLIFRCNNTNNNIYINNLNISCNENKSPSLSIKYFLHRFAIDFTVVYILLVICYNLYDTFSIGCFGNLYWYLAVYMFCPSHQIWIFCFGINISIECW